MINKNIFLNFIGQRELFLISILEIFKKEIRPIIENLAPFASEVQYFSHKRNAGSSQIEQTGRIFNFQAGRAGN